MDEICQALNSSKAASSSSIQCLEQLLDAKPELLQTSDRFGDLPLHAACSLRHEVDTPLLHTLPVLELLADRYPDALSLPNHHGMLPLHVAGWFFHRPQDIDIVQWLVHKYPQALEVADESGYRPLSFVIAKMVISNAPWDTTRAALLEFLIHHSPDSLWVPDNLGVLPLQYARQHGMRLLQLYCNSTARQGGMNKAVTEELKTPIHVAITSKKTKLEIIQAIFAALPEAIHASDKFGRLPLHSLMMTDFQEVQNWELFQKKLLWVLKADPMALIRQDQDGQTPFALLLENQSWRTETCFSPKDDDPMSIMAAATTIDIMDINYYGMPASLTRVHEQQERNAHLKSLVQTLLQHWHQWSSSSQYKNNRPKDSSCLFELSDKDGNVPLHLCVAHHCSETSAPELLTWILQADPGAVELVNRAGCTPLQIALQKTMDTKKKENDVSLNTIYTLLREEPYCLLYYYTDDEEE